MIPNRSVLLRAVSFVTCFGLLNLSVPYGAIGLFGAPFGEHFKRSATLNQQRERDLAEKRVLSSTRALTSKEQQSLQGKVGENPYMAGQNKWDVVYRNVDLLTGNILLAGTDLTFDGGYGIPVNVTRAYSANNADEGPFGKGWTLSADVRSTAGGLLKTKSAPVTAVPASIKERPALQSDPNVATQPVQAVTATDAGGKEETIQRDADGILTTPPWDNNTSDPTYEFQTLSGSVYQVLVSNKVTTLDGTVYIYKKEGSYVGGMVPYNNTSAAAQPSNVLKVVSATDRQGNVTTYTYSSTPVTFVKANGTVSENPLIQVQMPNGHTITFTWGNGTNAPINRIVTASDGTRTVTYGYTNGLLTSVTTPAGRTTTYSYSIPWTPSGWSSDVAGNVLRTVTDPRGLTTTYRNQMGVCFLEPYGVTVPGVICYRVDSPNGTSFYLSWMQSFNNNIIPPDGGNYYGAAGLNGFVEMVNGNPIDFWAVYCSNPSPGTIWVALTDEDHSNDRYGPATMAQDWHKTYDLNTQDLLEDYRKACSFTQGTAIGHIPTNRALYDGGFDNETVTRDTSYNFEGKPLTCTTVEQTTTHKPYVTTTTRSATISYAYWGADKYYQQKAMLDQAGRYSYTDYYPNSATQGSLGQKYRVYDPKNAGFYLDTTITPSAGTASTDYWKYQLKPSDPTAYTAQFSYDLNGRATDVWKLQDTSSRPWKYVQAHTTYGADTDGSWGQANSVVEDYGSSSINRSTQTLHYTAWGKADKVADAAGHVFTTAYDLDGLIQSVTRTDGSLNQAVASYVYGVTNGLLTNGQVMSYQDGLSGVTESFTYQASGGGIGSVNLVTESGGSNQSYSVSYSYNGAGDKDTVTYQTPSGTTSWKYTDYISVGDPTQYKRAFQTVCLLQNGNRTAEEYHYQYNSAGQMTAAAFAQTPQSGSPTANGYYDGKLAQSRATASYTYDPAGRVTSLVYNWETLSSGGNAYAQQAVLSDTCSYEVNTQLNRGLKLSSILATSTQSIRNNYGYDISLDYLTSASYGDGLANSNPTWSYDAAGNRTDSVCDNLNRPTSIQGTAVTSDILGNRLAAGSASYGWDLLNRMTSYTGPSGTTNYTYRADGLRVNKSSNSASTVYRYDGQMGMEDVDVNGTVTTVTDYAIGARGIDAISVTSASGTTVSYPLYDSHGNMVSTLAKSGSGYTYSAMRTFDAWGNIRLGAQSGDPKGRYCASLGHKQDDESGLVYMRARYYEPSSGRFLSEDSSRSGLNWLTYADSNPVGGVDQSGKYTDEEYKEWSENFQFFAGLALTIAGALTSPCGTAVALVSFAWLVLWIGIDAGSFDGSQSQMSRDIQSIAMLSLLTVMTAGTVAAGAVFYGGKSLDPVSNILGVVAAYGGMLLAFMAYNDMMG